MNYLRFVAALYGLQAILGRLGAERDLVACAAFVCCAMAAFVWFVAFDLAQTRVVADARAGLVYLSGAEMPGPLKPAESREMCRAAKGVLTISLIAAAGAYVIPGYAHYASTVAAIALLILLRPHESEDLRCVLKTVGVMVAVLGGGAALILGGMLLGK